eukprot:9109239-Karenia_brevis.AAC.1
MEQQRLAKEIAAALFTSGRQKPGGVRKLEWTCGACGTINFMDRAVCRSCATCKFGAGAGVRGSVPSPEGRAHGDPAARHSAPTPRTSA